MDINDIAKQAKVSRATVSRYLNNGYVSQEKRELIARVIEETGYVPSRHAQTLRTGRTKLVGVIIPKINSFSVSRMVAGITTSLADEGYQVLLANTDNNANKELEYLSIFAEQNQVDGIILIATLITPAHKRALQALNIPVVVLGQQVSGLNCIYHDNYHALFDITALALNNAVCPVFIGFNQDDIAAGKMRQQGFYDACIQAGITPLSNACAVGAFTADSGYSCTEYLLEQIPQLDTIVCANDDMAFGAITCLREYNKQVPNDVQVTGVGDGSLASIAYPALTTVHLYYKTSGEEAAKMLVDSITEKRLVPKQLMMGYAIQKRASTR